MILIKKDYLNNKRVFYQIEIDYVEMISSNISTSKKIVNYITKDLKDESYSMSMMLLFNDTYVDKASYENLKNANKRRIIRALEVTKIMKKPFLFLKSDKSQTKTFFIIRKKKRRCLYDFF